MKYQTLQGHDCLISCLQNILLSCGIDANESDLFLMGNGLRAKYIRDMDCSEPKFLLKGFNREACFNFLNSVDIKYENRNGDANSQSLDLIKQMLFEYTYICVELYSESLHYHDNFRIMKPSSHYVNILDYDTENKSFLISDGFIPPTLETFQGWVSEEEILCSWEKTSRSYICLNRDSIFKCTYKRDRDELKLSLRDSLTEYLEGIVTDNVYWGRNALIQMTEDMALISNWGKVNFFDKLMDIYIVLKTWGYCNGKTLMLCCLDQNESIPAYREIMREIIADLDILCNYIAKTAFSRRVENLQYLRGKAYDIVQKECSLYENILRSI